MERTQTTIRIGENLIEELDAEAEERDISRSEYIRQILCERGESEELRKEVDTLRDRVESREERIEDLEQQLARRSQIEDKIDTLAEREQQDDAPFFIKWMRWYRRQQK
jgi:Ribbon-helix-helix protein, copG family.